MTLVSALELSGNVDLVRQRLSDVERLARVVHWTWDPATDAIRSSTAGDLFAQIGIDEARASHTMEDLLALVPAADRGRLREGLTSVRRTGRPTSVEHSAIASDGTLRWFRTAVRADTDADGVVTLVHGAGHDITSARLAVERAARAESFWQHTLDALEAHVAVLDADGTIVAVNRAWTRFGEENGAQGESVGVNYLAASERADDPLARAIVAQLRAVLAGEQPRAQAEYTCHGPTQQRWFELTATPFGGDGDRRFVVLHNDVTRRKLAELASSSDRDQLREAHRVAGLGSWEVDLRTGRFTPSAQLVELLDSGDPGPRPRAEALTDHVWPVDRERLRQAFARAGEVDGSIRVEWRFGPKEAPRWAETRGVTIRDADGVATHLRGVTQDITERERAEQQIRMQADLLAAADVGVLASTPAGDVVFCNPAFEQLVQIPASQIIGRRTSDLVTAVGDIEHGAHLLTPAAGDSALAGEVHLRRPDGTRVQLHVRRGTLRDAEGTVLRRLTVAMDISSRVATERRLRGAHDFLDAVTNSIGDGVITVAPDGHATFANAAAAQLLGWEPADLVGQDVEPILGLGADQLTGPLRVDDDHFTRRDATLLPVSFSASPFLTESGESGTVVVFRDITARKADEARMLRRMSDMRWMDRIRQALADDRFVLYGQPIIDLRDGAVVQEELLIRMLDDTGGLVPPGDFLPVAERSGLIGDIDRWVVRQALGLAAGGRPVELNLSAHSVGDPAMLEFFEAALRDSGADPADLVVELTETALLDNPELAEQFVHRVRELGCKFALDDFGTGYGGFSYLKRLPVSYLKIDIEFVRNLPREPDSRHVVEAVIALARGFGLKTVAEGVEDDETLTLLRELGVDYAQGYGIGRPAPIT